jgi:hypothetical protein
VDSLVPVQTITSIGTPFIGLNLKASGGHTIAVGSDLIGNEWGLQPSPGGTSNTFLTPDRVGTQTRQRQTKRDQAPPPFPPPIPFGECYHYLPDPVQMHNDRTRAEQDPAGRYGIVDTITESGRTVQLRWGDSAENWGLLHIDNKLDHGWGNTLPLPAEPAREKPLSNPARWCPGSTARASAWVSQSLLPLHPSRRQLHPHCGMGGATGE